MKRKGKHLVLVDTTKTETPGKDIMERMKALGFDADKNKEKRGSDTKRT